MISGWDYIRYSKTAGKRAKKGRYEMDKIRGFHWQNMITFFILILS